jgi:hypothetical protein
MGASPGQRSAALRMPPQMLVIAPLLLGLPSLPTPLARGGAHGNKTSS